MRNVVITGATLVVAEGTRRSALTVHDGRIAAQDRAEDAWELPLPDHLIFPGLINAHDHLQLNSIPPLPHAAAFPNSYAWIAAFRPYLTAPAVRAATAVAADERYRHGGLKNLLSGATTVLHHDPWHPSLGEDSFPVRVLRDFHWSHSLGLGLEGGTVGLPPYGPPVVESYGAAPPRLPWIIHLGEGTDQVAAAELARLDELGCLAANTVLVHGVGLSAHDVELVIARGAGVIWCPASNLAVLGRTLEPRTLFGAGRLALGSDSRLTGSRDLLSELRVAATHSDLNPRELLQLATTDAARLLRAPQVGGLEPGQQADLLVLRDSGEDPYRQLLNASRAELRAVVRDGAPAVADVDLAAWFAACGLEAASVRLDGRPKLVARRYLRPARPPETGLTEPGLTWRAA
jgi:cytosine/adenosine deaminase-related metal-dependent hydrolase